MPLTFYIASLRRSLYEGRELQDQMVPLPSGLENGNRLFGNTNKSIFSKFDSEHELSEISPKILRQIKKTKSLHKICAI